MEKSRKRKREKLEFAINVTKIFDNWPGLTTTLWIVVGCLCVRNNAINQTNDFQKQLFPLLLPPFSAFLLASHVRISNFLRALVHFWIKYQQKQSTKRCNKYNDDKKKARSRNTVTFFSVKLILYLFLWICWLLDFFARIQHSSFFDVHFNSRKNWIEFLFQFAMIVKFVRIFYWLQTHLIYL